MAGFSSKGVRSLRKQNADTLDTDLVLYRNGVAQDSQRVALRRVTQKEIPDGEAIATPGGLLEIRGEVGAFDVRSGDKFAWDGLAWKVTQTPVATGTNTSVARRALATSEGKASG
jgi:hypothetical protein